jgi:hypothetical protein
MLKKIYCIGLLLVLTFALIARGESENRLVGSWSYRINNGQTQINFYSDGTMVTTFWESGIIPLHSVYSWHIDDERLVIEASELNEWAARAQSALHNTGGHKFDGRWSYEISDDTLTLAGIQRHTFDRVNK